MVEETEEKDETHTTLRANLNPGVADVIRDLHHRGVKLGLIADTRPGTYFNVLHQHELYGLFSVFSISEELGVEKPHPLMFEHALNAARKQGFLGTRPVMVGNNYYRDIVGGKQAGFATCWFHWNERYPAPYATPAADGVATSAAELQAWLENYILSHTAEERRA